VHTLKIAFHNLVEFSGPI